MASADFCAIIAAVSNCDAAKMAARHSDWSFFQDCIAAIDNNTLYADDQATIRSKIAESVDTPGYAEWMTVIDVIDMIMKRF